MLGFLAMNVKLLIRGIAGFALLFLLLVSSNTGRAEWRPWDIAAKKTTAVKKMKETNVFRLFFQDALHLFQTRISHIDGPRCNFYPTCSEYSRQCLVRYGLLKGIVMTAGRLLRCNYCAASHYPVKNGRLVDLP